MMSENDRPIPYSKLLPGDRETVRFLKNSVIEWVRSIRYKA